MALRFQDRAIHVTPDTIDSAISEYRKLIENLEKPVYHKHKYQTEKHSEKLSYMQYIAQILNDTKKILSNDKNWIDYVSWHNIKLLSQANLDTFLSTMRARGSRLCKECKHFHNNDKYKYSYGFSRKLCETSQLYCHKCRKTGHTSHAPHCRVCGIVGHDKWIHECIICHGFGHTYRTCQKDLM